MASRVLSCFVVILTAYCTTSFDPRLVTPGNQRVAARVAYDGTDFRGSQFQPGKARTVQGEIEKALRTVFQGDIRITASGRTDTGGAHLRWSSIV
jgi:hypothetical protein